jgi:hypothetical protein
MSLFPLAIFPEGGLVSSIITTVWVGVFVLCFFNLRYGWVLSGLVVPGYIVPLLIVKPVAGFVIILEAVLAYALVWLFSEKLSRGRYPSLFGRDRFMGLILTSIAVRLVMDGYILPEFAGWLETNFDRRFDWRDNLQSFGLVIISLLANQFWKPGLVRGLGAAVVTMGITYLVVRYGLMEFTNFRMSAVTYMYEGLASSILASPKAYIILTLTALIASHMNVRYGWDFSGILIPALIALQWYQPTKIVTSFVEAIVIYVIARLVLKLPSMANATIEGGRKLLLFFNISFAWKMALGWFVVWQGYDVKTTDFYGFGYLLSTLIAIKAHDKNIFPRLARSTLQVSFMGAVFGNIVGFALSAAVSRTPGISVTAEADGSSRSEERIELLAVEAIGDAYIRRVSGNAAPLSDTAREDLAELVHALQQGVPTSSPAFDMQAAGWRLMSVRDGRLAVVRADGAGHEMLLFDPSATRYAAIVLRDPASRPGLGVAALALRQQLDARWLVISAPGGTGTIAGPSVADVFADASDTVLLELQAGAGETSEIAYANASAAVLDLPSLEAAVPDIRAGIDIGARNGGGDRAVLSLSDAALEGLAALRVQRLRDGAACRLVANHNAGPKWREVERLAFIRYEVAEPFVASVREGKAATHARASAMIAGFAVVRCMLGGRTHWTLFSGQRDEGQIFLAESTPLAKSVLTWREEGYGKAARLGVAVHRNWASDVLLVAEQPDGFSRSPRSAMRVIWQEIVRQQDGQEEAFSFHLRERPKGAAFPEGRPEVLLVQDVLGPEYSELGDLASALRGAGIRTELSDGSRAFAGYEARPAQAERYYNATSGRRSAIGWVLNYGGGAQ